VNRREYAVRASTQLPQPEEGPRLLALRLRHSAHYQDVIVLALPRRGVPACCLPRGIRPITLAWCRGRRSWCEVIYWSDGEQCRAMSGFGRILRAPVKDGHYVRSHRDYIECDEGTPTSDSLFLGL
jgi:hypothetical protein